ncbi:dTDP-4-dehydrorhamnose reductase [Photobacterium iliopiscarium]|jgi:dTDP-4-dehydrorhamnose reductase|uniref:dTDP-4-dehydrorhamnose reductase n=1 Tax=Photobacterium iliopiscarium TaxID=56192 RepID=UPI0005D387DB|nr:dTDP-4-dehydrorhamnose reductase [Photobacterium iliopiscarium]KJG13753.1 dTDP-4-dehydrorhamnose reductase [Photobacterium iliopiscarium]PST87787.1 dTDP-4-dehydrorhamnose reductase [Photobacterium iliopiscarium]PSU01193.1 dTDP-4-dehydrorhamnose reductase [Photobacterium iliopiscarium]PSV83896.1 dTDP-4-dehydrorhamnose reductase [Photobacterium iliopiscarium]
MKVLITGCNGQVGSCLVNLLQNKASVEICAVDRAELDITQQDAVSHYVSSFQPDVIINAAAHTAVDKAEQQIELSYAINRDGPKYLAQAANEIGALMLHISTDYVFDGTKETTYVETDLVNPQSIYGITKLAGEEAVAEVCPRHIILRTAWVFSEYGNNFVKTMLGLAKQRDTLGIVADQFGGPTYAGDIAAALIKMAQVITDSNKLFDTTNYGIYHFSGLPHVSWCEFAQEIFNKAVDQGLLVKSPDVKGIKTEEYPTPAKRPANSTLNTNKITTVFNIPASNWQLALNHLADYV